MTKHKISSSILIVFCAIFANSCGSSFSRSGEYVSLLPMWDHTLPSEELRSVLSKYNIEIPFYFSKPGAVIHAVVIPINIHELSEPASYDKVSISLTLLERNETNYFDNTGNAAILTAIPQSIDRNTTVEESRKLAANFTMVVSEITGNIGTEQANKESYTKLYRIVTADIRSSTFVSWVFTPFKDESVPPGTYYLITLIEVRNQIHEFVVQVHANCTYSAPAWFGLSREEGSCTSNPIKLILPEVADIL